MLHEKLQYLSRGASAVIFAGSLPRGVDAGFYGEAIRDLNRRGVETTLDSEGQPLRLGTEAEPYLVSPNRQEAEALVGQEFDDDADFLMALDAIADMGARTVIITHDSGCFARFREERRVRRVRVLAPRVEALAPAGSGDVLLAGFVGARFAGDDIEDALRNGVAAGAVSTLQLGAGRFEPREVARVASEVRVDELEPVS